MKTAILLICLLSTIACGNKLPPDLSPEGKWAIRGTQVTESLRATIPTIKALVCTPNSSPAALLSCIRPADADKVFATLQEANDYTQKLGQALLALDTAKTSQESETTRARIRTIIQTLQKTISSIQIKPENEGARNGLVVLLSQVTNILLSLGF